MKLTVISLFCYMILGFSSHAQSVPEIDGIVWKINEAYADTIRVEAVENSYLLFQENKVLWSEDQYELFDYLHHPNSTNSRTAFGDAGPYNLRVDDGTYMLRIENEYDFEVLYSDPVNLIIKMDAVISAEYLESEDDIEYEIEYRLIKVQP